MMVDFLLFGLGALLMIPAVCAYYAHSRGRSFWLWFAIGTFLPIISYFILLLLPDRANPLEEALQDLRLNNKMLGTVSDLPIDNPISKKVSKAPIREISFQASTTAEGKKVLDIQVDGQSLIELLRKSEEPYAKADGTPELAGCYQGVPLTLALAPYKHFLGEPSRRYSFEGDSVLLVGNANIPASMRDEWRLSAKISFFRRVVVWHDLSLEAKKGKWPYFNLDLLVFNRYQYEESLKALSQYVS